MGCTQSCAHAQGGNGNKSSAGKGQTPHLSDSLQVPVLVKNGGPLCILLPCLPICFAPAMLFRVQQKYLHANTISYALLCVELQAKALLGDMQGQKRCPAELDSDRQVFQPAG